MLQASRPCAVARRGRNRDSAGKRRHARRVQRATEARTPGAFHDDPPAAEDHRAREVASLSFGSPAIRSLRTWPVALRPHLAVGLPLSGGVSAASVRKHLPCPFL